MKILEKTLLKTCSLAVECNFPHNVGLFPELAAHARTPPTLNEWNAALDELADLLYETVRFGRVEDQVLCSAVERFGEPFLQLLAVVEGTAIRNERVLLVPALI